ncbi:hypothetical protein KC19_6G210300 [Ceratodon purpureus]|uniref:Uncharacterized protein n=1 Tax=Ceratodon purpureus TaxID=3225 RepID=A0A8T0HJW5_CERPU|nr:hypothetical protein KC19_6G210300 [Ceratodon purpureus]
MAMATAAAMGSTALASPVQLQSASVARSAAACPGLASRSSVAFSGFNGAILKVNNAVGRIAFSNSSRLSVKAAMEVDISKIVPQADRVLIRLEALESVSHVSHSHLLCQSHSSITIFRLKEMLLPWVVAS